MKSDPGDSSSSTDSSNSSSSSISDDDTDDGIVEEVLGASVIHQRRSQKRPPLVGKPTIVFGDGSTSASRRGRDIADPGQFPDHLLERRIYPILYYPTENNEQLESKLSQPQDICQDEHSELERSVLMDCLSSNFMFSHLGKDEHERLCKVFQKFKVRKNEIIVSGDDTSYSSARTTKDPYLYVLYLGDVQIIDLDSGMPVDRSNEKYQFFNELEFLQSNSSSNLQKTGISLSDSTTPTKQVRNVRVKATSPCTLFRLSRLDYLKQISHQRSQSTDGNDVSYKSIDERLRLLKQSLPRELKQYFEDDSNDEGCDELGGDQTRLRQLASNMEVQRFRKDQVLVSKATKLNALVIVADGVARAVDVSSGGRAFEDVSFGPNESRHSFGWHALMTTTELPTDGRNPSDDPKATSDNNSTNITPEIGVRDSHHYHHSMMGKIVAESDGTALVLSQNVFQNVMGPSLSSIRQLAERRQARIEMQQISIFKDSSLTSTQYQQLLDLMHRCEYNDQDYIFRAGQKIEASMYFVREGAVTLLFDKGQTRQRIEKGGYFGEKNMLKDQNKERGFVKHWEFRSTFSAIATVPASISSSVSTSAVVLDVLTLEECRQVVDTTLLGLGRPVAIQSVDESIKFSNLHRKTLLGAGSFGQAWLATVDSNTSTTTPSETVNCAESMSGQRNEGEDQRPRVVALKIQAKHLIAKFPDKGYGVVAEKNIMSAMNSPFVIRLLSTFQDYQRLFLVMKIYQGGELESLIPHDGMSERDAKFYSAGILEGLSYIHKRHVIHRDVKPENILIDEKGYPVLADFGFAKYVPDKTFTFCGSPMLTAPEVIRYKGHDRSCDYWSWAVVVYRLVTGRYPFYEKGDDELSLYKRICKGTFQIDGTMSVELRMLLVAILYPDPARRLGSRVNGWRDIFASPWFESAASVDGESNKFDLRLLQKQKLSAPWVPQLKDPLDTSRFQFDWSNVDDMMKTCLPGISKEQQKVFEDFGPHIGVE